MKSLFAKLTFPGWLTVATVWFSTHAGGGFASGQQEVRFFIQQGWSAIWMPLAAMIFVGIVQYLSLNYARLTKSYDFRTWVQNFYSPYDHVFANLLDAMFLIFLCLPIGAAVAGGAELIKAYLDIPYVFSTFLSCGILIFFTIFGSKLVRQFAFIITSALLLLLGVIVYYGISFNHEISAEIVRQHIQPESTTMFSVLKWLILYAGFQCAVAPYVSVAEPLKKHSDCIKMAIAGVIINGLALFMVCWMLLGAYPAVLDKSIALPVLYIMDQMNQPILKDIYSVMLFLAFISTGVTFVFASVRRFENASIWNKLPNTNFFESAKARSTIIAIFTILYALVVSQFGLVKIIANGYRYMGIGQLIFIVIPLFIIGPYKIHSAMKGE